MDVESFIFTQHNPGKTSCRHVAILYDTLGDESLSVVQCFVLGNLE